MNTKQIIDKLDHDADNFPLALGISNDKTLTETVYDWVTGQENHSRVVEMILNHETLNDSEKVFCLVILGQISIFNHMMENENE